ncbi:zinc phosphodiesterase ELAC protein 2 isoform X2 [Patella vulgata]|uniref:zinc phosphodiesterase ELAC protein 2 isoform X2 n=1 Tax=Patella vulgata TaxID=6465 RepID=UPI00217F9373|nr:zinc phosphodiesterase ELAC protein 2 isoform X2 [Patella vulgata]
MYKKFISSPVCRFNTLFSLSNSVTTRNLLRSSTDAFYNTRVDYPTIYTVTGLFQLCRRYTCETNMPKLPHKKEKLRHIKIKEKTGGQVAKTIDIHVIGSGGDGNPQSVMISTCQSRYMFNCGEGTQRIANEFRMKTSKLENIFITHKSWNNIGGLLGMCLTLEGQALTKTTIHGPPNEKITSMNKGLGVQQDFILMKKEIEEGYFDDESFTIEYVPFYSGNKSPNSADESEPANKKRKMDNVDVSVGYILTPKACKRSLLLDKCVEAGVTPGPLFSRLQKGESITLENGNVVHPDDVLKPHEAQKAIIIVECVSSEFLPSLMSRKEFGRYTDDKDRTDDDTAELVIHLTPVEVLQSSQYQQWIKSFGESTQHIILNRSASDVCHTAVYRLQTVLNLLHPQVFPLLPSQTSPRPIISPDSNNIHLAHTNLIYRYRPSTGFITDQGPNLNTSIFEKEAKTKEDVIPLLKELKRKMKEVDTTKYSDKPYPEVVFLGTGASMPCKDRNVSCILVRLNKESNVLLDCGEGSADQIYRHYGSETDNILCNLKGVFISHMHLDHHLGVFNVVQKRNKAFERNGLPKTPVLVIAPGFMQKWIEFVDENLTPVLKDIRFIPTHKLTSAELCNDSMKLVLSMLQLQKFLPVEVKHCRHAYGVCIESDEVKLVYSGDTMPCDRLVTAGADCDLLIHEATMEDDLIDDAKFKTHSTTSQAIDVGVRMNAKFILLNHFSQRYSKVPNFNENFTDRVGISFDNMRVRLCDLPLLPHFLPVLKAIFADDIAELKIRSFRRSMKKQRLKEELNSTKSNSKVKGDELIEQNVTV